MSFSKEKREPEYPVDLETQFVLRLPEEPAKALREVLRKGDNLKNRFTIQVENDLRHGVVRFDNWVMHSKLVDLPSIVESLKTIDNKSFYKTADLCQMMICKEEPPEPTVEEDSSAKNKKKDNKVDKKFLWPHGITPPTKNVRKRRFRKTLKKKFAEAPEIEKEVKRLLRADNEAVSVTWEIVKEEEDDEDQDPLPIVKVKPDKKQKAERKPKKESHAKKSASKNVVDIFGGAVSDSDLEEEIINVELEDCHLSNNDSRLSDTSSVQGMSEIPYKKQTLPIEFNSRMFQPRKSLATHTVTSKSGAVSSEEDVDYRAHDNNMSKDNMTIRIEELKAEVEELKQRRQRTQHEIAGIENMALRQRFQDILHTLNQDIMYKEMEYQGMLTLQNSEDI